MIDNIPLYMTLLLGVSRPYSWRKSSWALEDRHFQLINTYKIELYLKKYAYERVWLTEHVGMEFANETLEHWMKELYATLEKLIQAKHATQEDMGHKGKEKCAIMNSRRVYVLYQIYFASWVVQFHGLEYWCIVQRLDSGSPFFR